MDMQRSINYFFGDKFVVDNRIDDATVNFKIPIGDNEFACGLVVPEYWYMVQVFLLLAIQTTAAAMIGLAVYQYILIPQRMSAKLKSVTPMSVYIFGFGIILPICFLQPPYVIDYLDIKNQGLKMLTLGISIQCSLRTLQAMSGFVPPGATKNRKNFIIYYSCLFDIAFDKATQEPKPISSRYMRSQLLKLARDYAVATCLLSLLLPCNTCFFDTGRLKPYSSGYSLKDMLSWRHMANNYLAACLLSTSLSQSTLGVSIMYNLVFGYETNEVVLNPMFKASSPSDFWGRRWNNSVHVGLKNGCYKPVRQWFQSRFLGVMASFVVSGILHEFVNIHIFSDIPDIKFQWRNMIFFGWNAVLIAMEYICCNYAVFQTVGKKLPSFIVTIFVISTALPVAHTFTGDWIKAGYFHHVAQAEAVLICNKL